MMETRCYSYIRFSSKEQRKGDSLRRQTAYAVEYAKKNGLKLDDSLEIHDLGLSAFHGDHRTKGALGGFLEQVKAGKIPKGSHLVIEALDRLTREELPEAYALFMGLISEDIVICTAADNMVYRRDNFDIVHIMFSAFKLAQGHEESFKKQQRTIKTWEGKRANLSIKQTKKAPSWLELSKDKTTFNIIPERAEVIKKIFEIKLNGCGSVRLAKILNKSDCWKPQSNRGNKLFGWQPSYIDKILRSKAVIGEFQPHHLVGGIRQPVGDPMPGYYPRIIEDEIFYSIQEQIARNKGKGGKNGKFLNMFGTLAKCGYCGAPMQFIIKDTSPKKHRYLVCHNARRAVECIYHSVRYQPFEDFVLKYCKGLEPAGILPDSLETQSEIFRLQNCLSAVRGKLIDFEQKIENLTEAVSDCPSKAVRDKLKERLSDLMQQSEESKEEEKRTLNEISRFTSSYSDTQKQLDNIKELVEILPTAGPEIRESLRNRLRLVVLT